jgi:hypothetical protein
MRKLLIVMMLVGCGGTNDTEEAPTCQQAVTAYYSTGCTFYLATGEEIPSGEIIVECRSILAEVSGVCQTKMDAWLLCLDSISPAEACDCSQEQEDLLACD